MLFHLSQNPMIKELEAEISLSIISVGLLSFGLANFIFNLTSSLTPDFKNNFLKDEIINVIAHNVPNIIFATSFYLLVIVIVFAQFLLVETETKLNFGVDQQ